MLEALIATILPIGFLAVLFYGGALFRRDNILQDGEAPVNRTLFYISKYSILALWGAMVLQIWGINLSLSEVPAFLQVTGLVLWYFGFAALYIGRFNLGSSFRLGTAREQTSLRTDGLFRLSRNPMYVGMYATIGASAVYTLNPVILVLAAFVIAIHHAIVLAEENQLAKVFGEEYLEYRNRVARYILI